MERDGQSSRRRSSGNDIKIHTELTTPIRVKKHEGIKRKGNQRLTQKTSESPSDLRCVDRVSRDLRRAGQVSPRSEASQSSYSFYITAQYFCCLLYQVHGGTYRNVMY